MLNEFYDLWQACERVGIDLPIRIPGFDKGQKADGIRLFMDQEGTVTRIEPVPAETMERIRKWACGSGITLPVFNFEPLHELPEEEFKKFQKAAGRAAKGKPADLASFLGPAETASPSRELRWPSGKIDHLDGAFKRVSADLLERIGQNEDAEGDGWRRLLQTLRKLNAEDWLNRVSAVIRQNAREQFVPALLDLLFHNSAKPKAGTVPVQFEMEAAGTPIYSERAQSWLTGVLARSVVLPSEGEVEVDETESASRAPGQQTVVWGAPEGSNRKYSEVKLPGLGKVRLFDRNVSEKPTSIRYDKRRPIFRVGADVRMKMMAALEWLVDQNRKGKTWALRSKFGKPDKLTKKPPSFLLLSYLVENAGSTPDHLAEIFAGPPEDEADRAAVQFETVCADTITALDGIPGLTGAARIQVFALHKPDGRNGRTQLFASESFTQAALRRLAECWQRDCRAHPLIELPQFPQEGGATPVNFEPLVPFPYQAIGCLNAIWEKCGKADDAKFESASDYSLADAFELLRRTGEDPTDAVYLGRMLDFAIRRALPLMCAVGQAMHQVRERERVFVAQGGKGSGERSRLQARLWPCLLSLLLARLGYKMEAFMKEPAYLIGHFLAQLDLLHAYYAKHVSGKEEGLRQLLGNSLMSTALESPLRALELAGQRMLPYQAWGYSFARGRKLAADLGAASEDARASNNDKWEVYRGLEALASIAEELSNYAIPEANRAKLPTRLGHEGKPPTKPVLDLTDTLKANDRAWMHSDAAAKTQMLLGYLARPARTQAPTATKPGAAPDLPESSAVTQPQDVPGTN
jgi:hypothetical protein